MDFTQLRYAVEVEKHHSISKAAQSLFMGQPNLSKSIKELESTLGITLFDRTSKGVFTTPLGAEFLSYAKSILSQVDHLESLYSSPLTESIHLSLCLPRATYLSHLIAQFFNTLSCETAIDIHYHETNTTTTIEKVFSGHADFGIIRYQTPYEDYFLSQLAHYALTFEYLTEFKLMLLMSENHPLACYQTVPYHLLSHYIEIVHGDFQLPPTYHITQKEEAFAKASQKKIYVYDRGSQYDLLKGIEGSFMWVSPFNDTILEDNHFILRSCDLSMVTHKDLCIYKASSPLNHYAKQLMDYLHTQIH